jgi:hypothetical protein
MGSKTVRCVVGNTHSRLTPGEASWNRERTLCKEHDWVLFVDIVGTDARKDADLIQCVEFELDESFSPQTFVCRSPVRVVLSDGSQVMRFSTRQQSTGAIVALVKVVGKDGSILSSERYPISLRAARRPFARLDVKQNNRQPRQKIGPTPGNVSFGVELELSCARGSTKEEVAQAIRDKAGANVTVITEFAQAHDPVRGWKIVHDGSIVCSTTAPDCSRFELVSPVLCGSKGMDDCKRVLQVLEGLRSISVNRSMGFHVHIGVESLSLQSMTNLCQNFVKYEDAIDSFMPASRRTGSRESDRYFRSNKAAIGAATNLERHNAIAACATTEDLCRLMNPTGRYYKLNMQNLVTGRQPTVEFRQHSATSNYHKVKAWVRFCMALVQNSARLKPPSALKSSRTACEQFDCLFEFVIKDRALRDVCAERRAEVAPSVATNEHHGACCDACAAPRR